MSVLSASALRGSITPILTPFRGGSLDLDTYQGLVDRQIREGDHGVLINGTTAEPSTLSLAERKRTLEAAWEVAKGRTQVVAATGSQSLEETMALSDHASALGVDALLVVTPYYLKPPQRGLVAYYEALGARSDVPLMIYHIPGRAAVEVQVETLEVIAEKVPHFVGVKHASRDLGFVSRALARLGDDFRIFVGLEELSFPMVAMGASGLMNAVGNLFPARVARLFEAADRGDLAEARRHHRDLFELNRAIFFDTNPIPLKYMAWRLGILAANEHRLPMMPPTPEVASRLDDVLRQAGVWEG